MRIAQICFQRYPSPTHMAGGDVRRSESMLLESPGWLLSRVFNPTSVENLDHVFFPGDASVMPYPFDTGGRAKFALSAGYGMVNIAMRTNAGLVPCAS